jgi:hypothetical protein
MDPTSFGGDDSLDRFSGRGLDRDRGRSPLHRLRTLWPRSPI